MRTLVRHHVVALLGLGLGLALAACPLPSNVRYRCEPDGTCAQADHRCAADGFCYPGECTPRDTAAECAQVECGLVADGCGGFADCAKWCPEGLECGVTEKNLCGAPRVCTPAGWCWENPLPQGATLYDAWRADERHLWFVGELGTVLLFDGEKSSLETLPVDAPATFYGIHGTSRTDLYVVGSDGLIFHYDGTAWTKEGLGSGVPATLRAVVALPDGRAVAVGEGGRVVFREPASPADRRWRDSTSGTTEDLMSVVALPDGGMLAASLNGTLLMQRADQLSWSRAPAARAPFSYSQTSGYGTHTLAVHQGRVFAGGTPGPSGLVQLEDDGGWAAATDAGSFDVYDVFGTDDELWTAGRFVGRLADGVADPNLPPPPNTPTYGPASLPWRAGVLLRPGEALVGGRLGAMAVARPTAGQLLMRSKGSVRDVNAVCGYGPGALYGASTVEAPSQGCGGGNCRPRVLERIEAPAGAYWRVNDGMQLGGTVELLGCYAYGPDRVWLMGNDSKYFSQSGSAWEYGDFGNTGITGAYIAGWGTPDAGYLFLRAGVSTVNESPDGQGNWNEQSVPGPGEPLNGVWGFGPTDKVLVGAGGKVLRWLTNNQWEDPPLTTGFTDELLTVHGAQLAQGGQRYVAAGVDGRVFMLETGDTSSTLSVGTSVRLTGSWVSTSGAAWVAGYLDQAQPRAFIARQAGPGGSFEPVPFLADRELRGLFGLDLPDGGHPVWVTGEDGLILRHDGP